jgi:hypothetical protein
VARCCSRTVASMCSDNSEATTKEFSDARVDTLKEYDFLEQQHLQNLSTG